MSCRTSPVRVSVTLVAFVLTAMSAVGKASVRSSSRTTVRLPVMVAPSACELNATCGVGGAVGAQATNVTRAAMSRKYRGKRFCRMDGSAFPDRVMAGYVSAVP